MEQLQAEHDEQSALAQQLTKEVATLTQQVAELDAAVAAATAQRGEEKEKNEVK